MRINYRKIYESHYGPVPRDADGRSYEIHHIDGDHSNNDPSNLRAVTLQEHYDIHYSQGDYGACYMMMSQRMKHTPEEIAELASAQQRQRVIQGTHHLLGGEIQRRLVKEGKHHLLSGEIQRKSALKRAKDGTLPGQGPLNPFWGGKIQKMAAAKQLAEGRHQSQQSWTCPHCDTQGKGLAIYSRWHGGNCRILDPAKSIVINGKRYASKKQAAKALNITIYAVSKLLKTNK